MERHPVARTERIRVTEDLLIGLRAKRVLEIGAGDFSFEYCGRRTGSAWVTADFEPPADILCELNATCVSLPVADESFDLVVCTEVLEHLLWPQALLTELHRVLVHDGRLLLSVPNVTSLSYRIAWLLGRVPSCAAAGNLPLELGNRTAYRRADAGMVGGHVIDFNPGRFRALLNLCGFAMGELHSAGIFWHRQVLPRWMVPASLSSNLITIATKHAGA